MTNVFIAGSRQLSSLNADVKLRIDTMIEKGFTILVGDAWHDHVFRVLSRSGEIVLAKPTAIGAGGGL